ncbi:MAG: DUF2809 domain-containing protein [Flavobacteriaceae bacterium]|nr:DUF2809 domain-containing protein [Bacteroidia bacterium]NNK83902.1 DUF2809 domain-containing protein [Flavobacteriaceae bacterium]
MTFNKIYFLLFTIFFIVELTIAYFIKDGFLRQTFGDFLVVIMLYYLIRSFIKIKPISTALLVLFIAFSIEFIQLTNFLEALGLENNIYAKTIFGSTFHSTDLIAYTLGVLTILFIDSK